MHFSPARAREPARGARLSGGRRSSEARARRGGGVCVGGGGRGSVGRSVGARERERERDFQPGLYVHQNRMWHLHIAGASHMCAHVNMRWLSQDGRLITHKVGRSRLCAKRPTLSDRWTDAFEISRQRFPLLARSYARSDRRGLTLSRIPRGSSRSRSGLDSSRVLSSRHHLGRESLAPTERPPKISRNARWR